MVIILLIKNCGQASLGNGVYKKLANIYSFRCANWGNFANCCFVLNF